MLEGDGFILPEYTFTKGISLFWGSVEIEIFQARRALFQADRQNVASNVRA